MQAELNIGTFGHVDHGKTTLTKALSGKWTDTHSEELKRGISIRLGYADVSVYKCEKCKKYSVNEKCECGNKAKFVRKFSLVDSPGHETLMTTAIAASSIIDGALFLIAANEKCPQPQTAEHLMILDAMGIKNIIIVQTKLDLVSKERAMEHYKEIKEFVKGTIAENAPIIPVVANHNINISALLEAIEKYIPTPKRDLSLDPKLYVSRSFDINKPGTPIEKLKGGVVGGSLIQGTLKKGMEVELRPGIEVKKEYKPVRFKIVSLREENEEFEEVHSGGLIAVGTTLDPALTKSDALVGSLLGLPNKLPPTTYELKVKYKLLKRPDLENPPLKVQEPLVLNVHTATTIGVVVSASKDEIELKLKRPVCVDKGSKIAISRRINQRWRLCGWGEIV